MSDQESYSHTGSNGPPWQSPVPEAPPQLGPGAIDAIAERLVEKLRLQSFDHERAAQRAIEQMAILDFWIENYFPGRHEVPTYRCAIKLLEEYRKLL